MPPPRLAIPALVGLAALAVSLWAGDSAPPDRVGLPKDYRATHTVIRHDYWAKRNQVVTAYANGPMATVTDLAQLPYPQGSVVVFEYAVPVKNADGSPAREPDGSYRKGEVTRLDVMRREPGYGATYGPDRAGEWEFASYFADGRTMPLPEGAAACAKCHQQPGPGRDFVFRGRFPPLR